MQSQSQPSNLRLERKATRLSETLRKKHFLRKLSYVAQVFYLQQVKSNDF